MITFKQFIAESINDKGILKAVFVVGLPGAGKSYTVTKLNGSVVPRVINTDKSSEFLSRKWNKEIHSANWIEYKDTAQRMTKNSLQNYINGMLPLFVDGTSNDVSNILHRIGILESLGYDVGMVFAHASLDTAMRRAKERADKIGRSVDESFIKQVHDRNKENADYLRSKISFFKQVENDTDGLNDAVMQDAFKKVQSFFSQPVNNPVGRRTLEELRDKKQKYLAPELIPLDVLERKIAGWYKS